MSFAVVPSLARLSQHYAWPAVLPVVGLAAALLGAVFPLVSHFGIVADERAGVQLSYVYVANIIGSAAGSLLTGFVLLDHFSYAANALGLALAGVALAAAIGFLGSSGRSRARPVLGVCALAAAGSSSRAVRPSTISTSGSSTAGHFAGQTFATVVENRSGVITVTDDDTVYGGGAYDGRFNISLESDENLILRAYGVGALHAAPRHVLMIGLSSGSWAQVIANLPGVESLDIVEINPGYEQIIAQHPTVASVLSNPKVHIYTDDGRRWLLRHPDARFDFIVQNTTWNWRAHITDLESVDYLTIVQAPPRAGRALLLQHHRVGRRAADGGDDLPLRAPGVQLHGGEQRAGRVGRRALAGDVARHDHRRQAGLRPDDGEGEGGLRGVARARAGQRGHLALRVAQQRAGADRRRRAGHRRQHAPRVARGPALSAPAVTALG